MRHNCWVLVAREVLVVRVEKEVLGAWEEMEVLELEALEASQHNPLVSCSPDKE